MGEKEEGGERFFLASNAPVSDGCPGLDCVLSYVREVLGNKTGKWKTQASVEFTAVTYEPGETVTDTEAPSSTLTRKKPGLGFGSGPSARADWVWDVLILAKIWGVQNLARLTVVF